MAVSLGMTDMDKKRNEYVRVDGAMVTLGLILRYNGMG